MTTEPLTKAARLAIGGAVAPVVRRQAAAPRKVTVIDKDGKPVRETTHVEVAKAVLARSEIEFSVQEGKRPEWVTCKDCGRPVPCPSTGRQPTICRPGTHQCGCGRPVMKSSTGKCGYGRKCKSCTNADKGRAVVDPGGSLRRVDDATLARVVGACTTFRAASAILGIGPCPIAKRAKRLGVLLRPKQEVDAT